MDQEALLRTDDWRLPAGIMPQMEALAAFTAHFGIERSSSRQKLLGQVVAAFARFPYENITKIIKRAESGSPEKARRYPEEVVRDHIAWGAGGTCFSLTSTLLHLIRALGWKAEPILADRRYGPDTHCALLVWIDGIPHLLDPGFLILDPIPLSSEETKIRTGINQLILEPESSETRIALSTVRQNAKTYRLTYKSSPVDEREFLKAWDASFSWDMMQYPLLTRTNASGQIYLRGSRLQMSKADSVAKKEITQDDLVARISAEFGINPAVVAHALTILKHGG